MPNNGYFDIKRDIDIEKAGGFFCHTCLVGKPIGDKSPDPRYCQGCYDCIKADKQGERKVTDLRDHWTEEGVFVHYGKKYGISRNLTSACFGAVTERPPDGVVGPSDKQEAVTKIADKGILPAIDTQREQGFLLQKRGRGRPRKQDDESVTRMTEWRRKQETQGVLV